MKRLDLRLVELGLAPSRSKAQQMIRAGEVEVELRGTWVISTDVSQPVDHSRVRGDAATLRYVSRGGHKLAGILDRLNLDVTDQRVLDVGLSTGGFTDCLLQRGAAAILGIDVGHGQVHASLVDDARLTAIEGLHVRDLGANETARAWLRDGVDLVVADVSFISLTLVVPALAPALPIGTRTLLLVKPQFETTADRLNRRGVVDDPTVFPEVRARVTEALTAHGFETLGYEPCVPKGQDGNQEFFAHGIRTSTP